MSDFTKKEIHYNSIFVSPIVNCLKESFSLSDINFLLTLGYVWNLVHGLTIIKYFISLLQPFKISLVNEKVKNIYNIYYIMYKKLYLQLK